MKGHSKGQIADGIRRSSAKIAAAAEAGGYSLLELERAAHELGLVEMRLANREYRRAGFQRNVLNIPDRAEELASDLSFLTSLGRVWAELLRPCGLSSRTSLLDIGCGMFPKVELGLYYAEFRGRVTMMDRSRLALKRASAMLGFFDVRFKVDTVAGSLWSKRQRRFDLICANHLIDDVVLEDHCRQSGIDLEDVYSSEESFKEVWNGILSDPRPAQNLMPDFAAGLVRLLRRGGKIVLLDYPSHSHQTLGLKRVGGFVRKLQQRLRAALQERGLEPLQVRAPRGARVGRIPFRSDFALCMHAPGGGKS